MCLVYESFISRQFKMSQHFNPLTAEPHIARAQRNLRHFPLQLSCLPDGSQTEVYAQLQCLSFFLSKITNNDVSLLPGPTPTSMPQALSHTLCVIHGPWEGSCPSHFPGDSAGHSDCQELTYDHTASRWRRRTPAPGFSCPKTGPGFSSLAACWNRLGSFKNPDACHTPYPCHGCDGGQEDSTSRNGEIFEYLLGTKPVF